MSLVRGQPWGAQAGFNGRFATAFLVSSCSVFALAGALGSPARTMLPLNVKVVAACAVLGGALAFDAFSLKHKSWCPITLRRQTPKNILQEHGPRRAAIAWGLDAGFVVTTFRMSSISWALLTLGLLGVAPWWLGVGYSAGFLVPLLIGCSLSRARPGSGSTTALAESLAKRPFVARTTCVAALALAMIATGAGLA